MSLPSQDNGFCDAIPYLMNGQRSADLAFVTEDDLKLLKGALRRAFARCSLHTRVLDKQAVAHEDPEHPRCKKWIWCACCGEVVPRWTADVDHIRPVMAASQVITDFTAHSMLDAIACEEANLEALCGSCHGRKSAAEGKARRAYKKAKKGSK